MTTDTEALALTGILLCDRLTLRQEGRALIREASLRVEPGTVTVLMGPSGVGKSLLASVLFGQEDAALGLDLRGRRGEAGTRGALVLQQGGGLPQLTVRQNLELVARGEGLVEPLLQQLRLPADQLPTSLSGGQQRRLATARALAAGRDLLWLDEPAAGLDVLSATELAAQLREEARTRGLALVIAEHRPEFIRAVADRVVVLDWLGTLHELAPEELGSLEARFVALVGEAPAARRLKTWRRGGLPMWLGSLGALLPALYGLTGLLGRTGRCWWRTLGQVLRDSGLRGLPFHLLVSAIFGAIFVLVFQMTVPFLDTALVLERFGALVIARVAAPLGAVLAAAQSGAAGAAWIAQLSLRREPESLRSLGVSVERALWGPAWLGLFLSVLLSCAAFAGGLLAVFSAWLMLVAEQSPQGLIQRTVQFGLQDAAPRVLLFAALVATVALHCARQPASVPADVARAITRTIVVSTLWIMVSELVLLALERG